MASDERRDAGPAPGAGEGPGAPPRRRKPLSRRAKIIALLIASVVTAIALLVWWLIVRNRVRTDDAYVAGDVVALGVRVRGQVAEVFIVENQRVRRGELLLRIDDEDYAARVRQAEAERETAEGQAREARAAAARAAADRERAILDLARARELRRRGATPQATLDRARTDELAAEAAVSQAAARAAQADAAVRQRQALLDLARQQLAWTRVFAPGDGEVSNLTVHAGSLVEAGQTVAQLVPGATYVVANFKETQLRRVRPGQRARVEVDTFDRAFDGAVESIAGATGSVFSLLPPENASGNFVKVVQRVPVRIAWRGLPPGVRVRPGMSVTATVFVDEDGERERRGAGETFELAPRAK